MVVKANLRFSASYLVLFLLFFSIELPGQVYPQLQCLHQSTWICFEHALEVENQARNGFIQACVTSSPARGLPPIVVPMIASFDPFTVAISAKRFNRPEWDPIAGYGTECSIDFLGFHLNEIYRKSCREGVAGSCSKWVVTAGSFGTDEEAEQARSLSCVAEDATNCSLAAAFAKEEHESFALLSIGCRKKDVVSCRDLGMRLSRMGDSARAKQLWESACDEGDVIACRWRGNGENALVWQEKGCRLGALGDCDSPLSAFLKINERSKADEMCSVACQHGQSTCCSYLGDNALANGKIKEASDLYQTGCLNNPKACYAWTYYSALSYAEEHGLEVENICSASGGIACLAAAIYQLKNKKFEPTRSLAFIERGCETSNSQSCYFLATYFRDSHRPGAKKYFEKACHLGVGNACLSANSTETEPPQPNIFDYATYRIRKKIN